MPSADFATSDEQVGSVDLKPVPRVQGAMARKRQSVQRRVPTDLRLQRKVLRRAKRREKNRVMPLLHRAANELVTEAGKRNIVLEDLTKTQEELLKTTKGRDQRRRLSVWTQGQFQRIVGYQAHTRVLHVNPRGTSSECPRCGGRLDHPVWRRSICANCQGDWHRDMVAATSILSRGEFVLRGTALSPRAPDALLERSRWGGSSAGASMNGDEAKLGRMVV